MVYYTGMCKCKKKGLVLNAISVNCSENEGHTFLSAIYRASASLAKFSLMCTPCNPLPSAANLLSKGMVYPCTKHNRISITKILQQTYIPYYSNL